jgi:transcription elongation factor SPT6
MCYEEPGRFLLCYQPGTRVKREFVTVTPKGLRYRKRYFATAERLIDYFKRHWKEVVPYSQPTSSTQYTQYRR